MVPFGASLSNLFHFDREGIVVVGAVQIWDGCRRFERLKAAFALCYWACRFILLRSSAIQAKIEGL
jgi:hypothetical protein